MQLSNWAISGFGTAFVVATLFPFVGNPSLDSQPFPLVFALVYLCALCIGGEHVSMPRKVRWFFSCISLGSLCAVLRDGEFNIMTVRAVAGYAALAVYYVTFVNYLRQHGFPLQVFLFALIVWLLVGVIQLFEPGVVSAYVAQRSTPERGVTSLAPEPTHFAVFLFFACWLVVMSNRYEVSRINIGVFLVCLAGALLLAKSSMIVIFLAIALCVAVAFLLVTRRYLFLVNGVLGGAMVVALLLSVLPLDSRLITFFSSVSSEGLLFFGADTSSNQRISGIVLPMLALIDNSLLPAGFLSYATDATLVADKLWPMFPFDLGQKIMSWNLAMWYELGIWGMVGWVCLIYRPGTWTISEFFEYFLLVCLLFSSVPHLFPLPMMIMAFMDYRRSLRMRDVEPRQWADVSPAHVPLAGDLAT